MSEYLIDGKLVADKNKIEITKNVLSLKQKTGIIPGLATILIGDDPASQIYVNRKNKACKEVGIHSEIVQLPENTSQNKLLELIQTLNNSNTFHGIIVQNPLPNHIETSLIANAVSPLKDVDGFHPTNIGLLATGKPQFIPATPLGIIELFKYYQIKTSGKKIAICGRGNIVGKPLSILLSLKGYDATVTLCHSKTQKLTDITKNSEIVISAIGIPHFIRENMISKGAIIIDVGINRIFEKNNKKLVGDVFFEEVEKKAKAITPVPGGVGPMTIAMLLKNTLKSASSNFD